MPSQGVCEEELKPWGWWGNVPDQRDFHRSFSLLLLWKIPEVNTIISEIYFVLQNAEAWYMFSWPRCLGSLVTHDIILMSLCQKGMLP